MKHNTSREKPAERQMFKGTRNLKSQSSGGEPGVTESKGCALQGNKKWNAQGDFDLVLPDPTGRQGDVSGTRWSPPPNPLEPTAHPLTCDARPYSWRHSGVRHPRAGARWQFALPWSFSALYTIIYSSSPTLHPGVFSLAHRCCAEVLSSHWQQQKCFDQSGPWTGQVCRSSFAPSVATREISSSSKSGGAVSKCGCAATRL